MTAETNAQTNASNSEVTLPANKLKAVMYAQYTTRKLIKQRVTIFHRAIPNIQSSYLK